MHRVGHSRVVDKAHDCLAPLLNEEGRAGRLTVISNKGSIAPIWVDALGEGLDVSLIVVDWKIGHWIGDCSDALFWVRDHGKIEAREKGDYFTGVFTGGIGRGN
jgi:hypothetical protein